MQARNRYIGRLLGGRSIWWPIQASEQSGDSPVPLTGGSRGVAQLARAPVSKTGGWGFETLHPCQRPAEHAIFHPTQLWGLENNVAVDPAKFVREVRSEMARVTWPSRKETLVTTGLVFAMVALAAMFFFLVDQFIGIGIRALFGMSA
jgi:preprotein translocase subunit SecE